MWTPRATSTTPTWQDTHKLSWRKDKRANQNPQKSVFTSMYTKRFRGLLARKLSVWGMCACTHAHTAHVSCPRNTCGDHQAHQSATCHWVQFPHGDQLREGLWEEKGRDMEGRGSEPTPARRHPSVNIRGWLNTLASFLPSPPIVQHHPCSHHQWWEGQLQQSVSENADTVFYTRLLQASKCYINKAEQILSLPSCAQ